jgi:ABC-type taurine transport system substrate-binding protein
MSNTHSKRSTLIAASLAIGLLVAPLTEAAEQLRIGYQKSSTLISLLKSQGTLEKALADQDITISWHEFPNGQPLLEALNVGNIDLSADVADTVPVFAQAAGADLAYFAQEAPSPSAQAIIVREDSPIKTLADLKGKRGSTGAPGSATEVMAFRLIEAGGHGVVSVASNLVPDRMVAMIHAALQGDFERARALEAELAVIWAELLERPQVAAHEDFFALGGHSLLAARLAVFVLLPTLIVRKSKRKKKITSSHGDWYMKNKNLCSNA